MFLLSLKENEYDTKVAPFLKNGVLLDTSTFFEFIQGLINTRRNTADTGWKDEYQKITNLFERIKLRWDKIFLTPHIMTETCSHFNKLYHTRNHDFTEISKEFISIINTTSEKTPIKKECTKCYKYGTSLEIGDLSIYAVVDDFAKDKKKIAIITKDGGFQTRYATNSYVMIIDHTLIQDLVSG